MPDEIEKRLREHAEAFNGLLSLIPAKLYYGEDVSDQWQRKKQTKEQKHAAKQAKLNPNNYKTAKDVLDERATAASKKRKLGEDEDNDNSNAGVPNREKPREGLKRLKKLKFSGDKDADLANGPITSQRSERPKPPGPEEKEGSPERPTARRQREEAGLSRVHQKQARQTAPKSSKASESTGADSNIRSTDKTWSHNSGVAHDSKIRDDSTKPSSDVRYNEDDRFASTLSPSPDAPSSTFDAPLITATRSGSSSISSVQLAADMLSPDPIPKTQTDAARPVDQKSQLPPNDTSKNKPSAAELRQRLAARIEALRAARNADGLNGQPARSRQELLESRRKKEEARQAHKKELRRQAKEEEARKRHEEMAQRFSPGGSGSLLASPMSPLPSDVGSNNFTFGHVAFGDGSQMGDSGSKKKGPSDPATALKAAQANHNRVSALDAEKRANIEDKNMWSNANKRARGEKLRDDTSLLKKALKRKESQKGKSAKEWQDRTEGVQKAIQGKQRKREDNLRKRREDKGAGKGKKSGQAGKAKGGKTVKRPGFEGSFRARSRRGGHVKM